MRRASRVEARAHKPWSAKGTVGNARLLLLEAVAGIPDAAVRGPGGRLELQPALRR